MEEYYEKYLTDPERMKFFKICRNGMDCLLLLEEIDIEKNNRFVPGEILTFW